jgi:restriction endonuclease Mrr
MNTGEIDRFTARLVRFTDRGLTMDDAERMADRLVIRDRQKDDRAICLECTHLHRAGRCGNWQRAGVAIQSRDAQLAPEFMHLLQRCDGFKGD